MATCAIQWIDKQGNPTPDNNQAIGEAIATFPDGRKSNPFPICQTHADQAKSMPNWTVYYTACGCKEHRFCQSWRGGVR